MRSMKDVAVLLSIGALVSLTSCQRSCSPSADYAHPGPPRYEIECTVDGACAESVALLVGLSAPEEPMRCTAALIGERTAITAGHCVATELSTGGSCVGVWLGFAGAKDRTTEWVGCRRIASATIHPPALLSPDYAIIELDREVRRAPYPIDREPVSSGQIVRMVSVTADRFYDRVHQVRSRRCVVDDNGSLAPWSPHAPSSIRVLSSCPVRAGRSGAPVLDQEGRMRGLIHGGGPRYFAFGLMTPLPQPVDRDDG